MTLLRFEKQRVDEDFDARWQMWQRSQGLDVGVTRQEAGLLYDPLASNIYEYYAQVPLGTARQVMLAGRSAGMYSLVQQRVYEGALATTLGQAACTWLHHLVTEQLQQILPDHAAFWQEYATWPLVCQHAYADERRVLSVAQQTYAPDHFATIVAGKTVAARLIIATFAALSADVDRCGVLYEVQRHLSMGLHLMHDVQHWKQHFIAGTMSYLLSTLLRGFPDLVVADSPEMRREQAIDVGRRLYYGGLAEQFLAAASDHFYRALAAATLLPPTPLGALVAHLVEQNEELRKDIARVRGRVLAGLSATRPSNVADLATHGVDISVALLERAMDSAASYLVQEQAADGSWGDFMLLAEQSTFWVTGYVAWTLQFTRPAAADLSRAANWLLAQQYPGGGWGYNNHWPVDTDSTANALLFLSGCADVAPERWADALRVCLSGERRGGGFTTILDPDAWVDRFRASSVNLQGWTAAHPCVTGVVALLFATLNQPQLGPVLQRTIAYLRDNQSPEGYWPAYWWAGLLYTTCRSVQALLALGTPPDDPALVRARNWLLASQRSDGGWSAPDEPSQAFHTAFAVQALACLGGDATARAALRRGVEWLLVQQQPNGSWVIAPVLRVPRPNNIRPWEGTTWRESMIGLDVVVADWRRLFTTATVLQALHTYTRTLLAGDQD